MSDIIKKPYEISLWEDVEITQTKDGVTTRYYDEQKICVIGSDNMTSPIRAIKPSFKRNINGTNTLAFSIINRYFDEDLNDFCLNPFVSLLVNERKIKLKYDNKWYDLIIKNIDEDSTNNTFSYIASDLHINELSKTGFSLTFNKDLENNIGNITELAERVVEGTEWTIGESELIKQTKEETLYEVFLNKKITVFSCEGNVQKELTDLNTPIYVFYSCLNNHSNYFQLLLDIKTTDENGLVISDNYYIKPNVFDENGNPDFIKSFSVINKQGKRLVRNVLTKYDEVSDEYVTVYKDGSEEIYGFTKTEYITSETIKNYIVNSSNNTTTVGWAAYGNSSISLGIENNLNVLKLGFTTNADYIYNAGIISNAPSIGDFIKDQSYIFKVKGNDIPKIKIAKFSFDKTGKVVLGDIYFDSSQASKKTFSDGDFYYTLPCLKSASYNELKAGNIGIFLSKNSSNTCTVNRIQFFPLVVTEDGESFYLPESLPEAKAVTKYYYYKPSENVTSKDEIQYIYIGEEPAKYVEEYNENFEKRRAIEISESNRFNIIQSLCETFECWAKFTIEHDNTGKIIRDEVTKKPKKTLSFHNFIGQENDRGFKYGINLNSVSRQINSDQIVSKIIVKANSNEYAIDGGAMISRAINSPNGEDFLYNFDYYIQQGMLESSAVNNDLYGANLPGWLCYYTNLKKINNDTKKYIEELVAATSARTELEAALIVQEETVSAAAAELNTATTNLNSLGSNAGGTVEYEKATVAVNTCSKILGEAKDELEKTKKSFDEINTKISTIEDLIETNKEEKEKLHSSFYNKYSRFIQEGSWISEDYTDDDLYYFDAENVLNTSSKPQVTYNINVIEISQVEGYENYHFELGDKTYIEDTEFFGWVVKNGMKTPYQEEIIISEVNYYLDSPEINTVTVQNYKTQFEDLFQRITATTQALEYSTGSYNKVSNIITEDGTIKFETLQSSLLNNSFTITNSVNQAVVTDDKGITITNKTNPNEIVKLVSGGVFISSDGGANWTLGLNGRGINATSITAGYLNASVVNIMSNGIPVFKWDDKGISAYQNRIDTNSETVTYDYSTFVRLDQYGLYGIRNNLNYVANSIEEVERDAAFGLTWNGFFIRNKYDDGGVVSIDSINDFIVKQNNIIRIKTGKISDGKYGMVIYNENSQPTLSAVNGELTLSDKLIIAPSDYKARAYFGIVEKYPVGSKAQYSKIMSISNLNEEETLAIYDDGRIVAGNVHFTGGTIGNLKIEELDELGKEPAIKVELENGNIFDVYNTSEQNSSLNFEVSLVSCPEDVTLKWQLSSTLQKNSVWDTLTTTDENGVVTELNALSYSLKYSECKKYFSTSSFCYLKLTALKDNKEIVSKVVVLERKIVETDNTKKTIRSSTNEMILYNYDSDNILNFYPEKINFYLENDSTGEVAQETQLDYTTTTDPSGSEKKESDYFKIHNINDEEFSKNFVDNIKSDNNQYSFDLSTLFSDKTLAGFLSRAKINYFTIGIKSGSTTYTKKIIIRLADASDLLQFSINSYDLNASIENSKLVFNADGLSITNGGLAIYKDEEDGTRSNQLYFDEDGNLTIKGIITATSGSFTGEVNATSGSFTGTVNAQDGSFSGTIIAKDGSLENISIGNIKIGKISSDSEDYGIYTKGFSEESEEGFLIKDSGQIIANNFIIKNGVLTNKLKIGDLTIFKPTSANQPYIQINKDGNNVFSLNGKELQLGSNDSYIKLDFINKQISTDNYSTDTGWSISPTEAVFNNIVARGSIKAAVLEYAEMQAIGGIVIIRPSTIIKDAIVDGNTTYIKLENPNIFYSGDICRISSSADTNDQLLNSSYVKIFALENNSSYEDRYNFRIEKSIPVEELIGHSIISFISENSSTGKVGLAINSTNSEVLVAPASFSLFEASGIEEEDIKLQIKTKLTLGKLPENISQKLESTYGLYCDNVYVTGMLTSDSNNFSAGIQTTSNDSFKIDLRAYEEYFLENSDSYKPDINSDNTAQIIFWAGEKKTNNFSYAEDSNFIVDSQGHMFARDGYFSGIIRSSKIYASEIRADNIIESPVIRTAEIIGTENEEEYSLKITGPKGIVYSENSKTILDLDNNGIQLNGILNIKDANAYIKTPEINIIDFSGTSVGGTFILPNKIGFSSSEDIDENTTGNYSSSVYLSVNENKSLKLFSESGSVTSEIFDFGLITSTINTNNFKVTNNVNFGETLEFKPYKENDKLKGYDIFVVEEVE